MLKGLSPFSGNILKKTYLEPLTPVLAFNKRLFLANKTGRFSSLSSQIISDNESEE